jgi:ribosomal protein S18 acetylase RimI-like enzyme
VEQPIVALPRWALQGREIMQLPNNFTLSRLAGSPTPAHAAARQFCLDTIKEFYGFDYNPDWHLDIDTLLRSEAENHYAQPNRGAFWIVSNEHNDLVATVGVRGLRFKPALVEAFRVRYPEPDKVGSLWRLYVRKDQRGHGLGTKLNLLVEEESLKLGYTNMYLHASSDAVATIGFWKSVGYENIGEWDFSTHFDKKLQLVDA